MYETFEKLLQQKGLTTYKIAKETKLSPSMFTDWKQGKYIPKTDKLKKIADYLDVSVDYLMTGEAKETDYYLNKDAKEMAQFLFENPDYKILFDASMKVKRKDLEIVKEVIDRFAQ